MKAVNIVLKTALVVFFAFGGTGVQPANAMDLRLKGDLGSVRKNAGQWLNDLEHPDSYFKPYEGTDTLEVYRGARVGNLDEFARHYAEAAGKAIEHYIDTNLLSGPANTVMLAVTCANRANAAANGAITALTGGNWIALQGGAGGANGHYVINEMPAGLTKGEFITALKERMKNISVTRLHHLNVFALPVLPIRLTGHEITVIKNDIRDAVKIAVTEWVSELATGGAGADMFAAAVANGAGGAGFAGAGLRPELTLAGFGGPGMSIDPGNRAAPLPGDLHPAAIAAAFDTVIDFVDTF